MGCNHPRHGTFADSRIYDATSAQAGSAAKVRQTQRLTNMRQQAIDIIEDIGRRISVITEEPLETINFFQRISVAIQRGNAVSFSFMSTFDDDYRSHSNHASCT